MTTGNLLAIYDTITDRPGVAMTASSGSSTLSRLLDIRPGYPWQTTGCAAEHLKLDAGSGESFDVDTVAIVGHNANLDGTIRTRISDQADLSSPTLDRSDDYWPPVYGLGDQFGLYFGGYPQLTDFAQFTYFRVVRLGAQYSGRYLRLDLANATNADGVLRTGRVMAGIGWQPTRNFQFGWTMRWVDPSPVRRTDGGGVIASRKVKFREFTISIGGGGLPLAEMLTYADDMIRILGRTRPLLLMLFPDGDVNRIYRTSVYGVISSEAAIVGQHYELGSVAQFTVQELR